MAAIFGIIAIAPGVDPVALARPMEADLAYSAPDGFTRWTGEGCLLAHGALHIGAKPERAVQPLRLADGRVLVADAYVANFDEVRRTLGVDPQRALDDAQLLALAIERWGSAFTGHVHGEFAVALWNPAGRALELYCDHLGARSITYVHTPRQFAFATAAGALTTLPDVPARLDPLGIATIWYGDAAYLDHSYAAFENMHRLAPAHRMEWREGGLPTQHRYWRLEPCEPTFRRGEDDYVAAFREVFGGAVNRAMRGSHGAALMLSGGMDSGAVLAARRGFRADGDADDLLCVSAVSGPGIDDPVAQKESANIRAMTARHAQKLQFSVPVDDAPDSLVSSADLAEVAWSWMHPLDLSLLVPSLACRLARKAGYRLMLDGVDGDVMTSVGMPYIDALARAGHFVQAWRESGQAGRVNTYLQGRSRARLLARALASSVLPDAVWRSYRRRRCEREVAGLDSHPVMAPALARRIDLAARLRRANAIQSDTSAQQRCDHKAWWLSLSLNGSRAIVQRYGQTIRHPWCDLQVLDFFQRLPLQYQTRHGWTKWVVRQACAASLGPQVAWHSGKHHLGFWLNAQVLADAAPYLRGLLEEERPLLLEYIRPEAIADCVRLLTNAAVVDPKDFDTLLTVTSLAGWLRHVRARTSGDGSREKS